MDYLTLRERPRQFLALTSLQVAEFDELLTDFEKPPKWGLTFSQQLYSQLLNPLRVVVEHAHSGIKRLRIVADTLRLRGEWRRDTVMVVACGLHNLRVHSPYRAYLAQAPVKLSNLSE